MALEHGGSVEILSRESKGRPVDIIRDYEPEADTPWRFGLPDYATVNKAYFAHRRREHAAGSLEAVVQELVKNWEVESHHLGEVSRWRTMDVARFQAFSNGAGPVDAATMAEIGQYIMLHGDCMRHYKGSSETFKSANDAFKLAFCEGFAFEVLEVLVASRRLLHLAPLRAHGQRMPCAWREGWDYRPLSGPCEQGSRNRGAANSL